MNRIFYWSLFGILILFLLSLTFPKLGSVGYFAASNSIDEKIKNFYELALPNTEVEVIMKKEEFGMYRVLVKVTGPNGVSYRETYVSKDGNLLTENPVFVERAITQINRTKNFVECLANRGVRIYGISNQTQTLLQLNLLGLYGSMLYVPCDGPLIANCINANVTQVPSVVINGKVYPGIKTISWFAQQTGCEF